jgi:hypothetical protein
LAAAFGKNKCAVLYLGYKMGKYFSSHVEQSQKIMAYSFCD